MHIIGAKMTIFTLSPQKNHKKNLAIFPQLIIPHFCHTTDEYHTFLQPAYLIRCFYETMKENLSKKTRNSFNRPAIKTKVSKKIKKHLQNPYFFLKFATYLEHLFTTYEKIGHPNVDSSTNRLHSMQQSPHQHQ